MNVGVVDTIRNGKRDHTGYYWVLRARDLRALQRGRQPAKTVEDATAISLDDAERHPLRVWCVVGLERRDRPLRGVAGAVGARRSGPREPVYLGDSGRRVQYGTASLLQRPADRETLLSLS